MLQLKAALVSIAAEFTGKYSPFQSVQISPAGVDNGVFVASTDKGNIACLAYDPAGQADESIQIIPSKELVAACKPIKTAERELRITDNSALVTTYRKTTNEAKELSIQKSQVDFPDLAKAIRDCINRWTALPEISKTAGRYDQLYLQKAIKGLSAFDSSIVMSAFDGGPLRLETDDNNVIILVMPQEAKPIPRLPEWICKYAQKE